VTIISEKTVENVVHLIWVSRHGGMEGKELADRAAKNGSLHSQSEADDGISDESTVTFHLSHGTRN